LLAEWLERLHRRPPGGATESRLGALNIPALSSRLDELMRRDRYYANEELTIADLARALNITSHQVSELLNRRLATSFFHYVNGFRVQEACRLLRGEGDRTILSIAYEVGFNSKSAFHRAFSRHTGLSPREFRRASRADAAGDESV
ncbi:MAG: AraC family transcriptional regulator, partial [Leptospirales bacterium]